LTDPKEISNVHNYSDRQIGNIAQLNEYYSTYYNVFGKLECNPHTCAQAVTREVSEEDATGTQF
jgi:hypothetical protein